jgi:mono/diheme cytochrome c family protein
MAAWHYGLGALGAALAAVTAIALWPAGARQDPGQLHWRDADVVARGARVYADHCAACHGADLGGQPDWRVRRDDGRLPAPPHDETGHTWHHPDAGLIDITTRGPAAVVGRGYESDMMGFGDVLDRDAIVAVLSYIKSTWPADIIEIHDRVNADAAGR